MSADGQPPAGDTAPVPSPPRVEDLERIGPDRWAGLLRHVRAALNELDETLVTAEVRRLRAAPLGRLAGGRTRRDLCRLLARGGPLWQDVHTRVAADDGLAGSLPWLLSGRPATYTGASPRPSAPRPTAPAPDDGRIRELKERARVLKDERDTARRQADGAEARAEAAEQLVDEAAVEIERLRATVEDLRGELAERDAGRARAVERERRRQESEIARLQEELRSMRRREERRRERERRRRQRQAAETPATPSGTSGTDRAAAPAPRTNAVPGRPTMLPDGMVPGTRDAAEAVLEAGRTVLIDGYNVTKQHQPDLSLAEQREWLIRLLAGVVSRRRIVPTVFFDGTAAGGGRPADRARGVQVQFSPPEVTADDDIVLALEATDHDSPVTVVTDDRGLADRVRPYRVDILPTQQFLWVAR